MKNKDRNQFWFLSFCLLKNSIKINQKYRQNIIINQTKITFAI